MTTSSTPHKKSSRFTKLRQTAIGIAIGMAALLPTTALGWDYAKEPLFWNAGVKPNVALMIDNSGSMAALVVNDKNYLKSTTKSSIQKWEYCTAKNVSTGACSAWSTIPTGFSVFPEVLSYGKLTLEFQAAWIPSVSSVANCPSNGGSGFFKSSSGTNLTTNYSGTIGICWPEHSLSNGDTIRFTTAPNGNTVVALNTNYTVTNATNQGFQLQGLTSISSKRLSSSSSTSTMFKLVGTYDAYHWGYHFNTHSGTSKTITNTPTLYCDLTKPLSGANNFLGVSGSVSRTDPVAEKNIGMVVRKGNIQACVRWQFATTADTKVSGAPGNTDYNAGYSIGTAYFVPNDDALTNYGNHLLNTYVTSSGNYNLDEDYPDISDRTRLQAAREAAQQVVLDYADRMQIGLFTFNSSLVYRVPIYGTSPATNIQGLVGDKISMDILPEHAIDGAIGNLRGTQQTPLGSTYKSMVTYFGKNQKTTSDAGPISYRCQKNYGIVMTDGEASDSNKSQLVLEALTGFNTDLRPASQVDEDNKSFNDASNPAWVEQNLIPYTIGFGEENEVLKRTPLVNRISVPSTSILQNTVTLVSHGLKMGDPIIVDAGAANATTVANATVGTLRYAAVVDNDKFRIVDAAEKAAGCASASKTGCLSISGAKVFATGPGKSFFAVTPEELTEDLGSVFKELENITASSSGVSANSKQVGGDTLIYQAKFTTKDWSGEVSAYPIDTTGGKASVNTKAPPSGKGWTTKNTVKSVGQRSTSKLYTWSTRIPAGSSSASGAMAFAATDATYDSLNADQQRALGANKDAAKNTISWLIGNEVTGFRPRASENGLLGDIINADPEYLGAHNFGYEALPSSEMNCSGTGCTGKESYTAYVQANKSRSGVLFTGTNHGFIHALDASTGEELMAYVPAGVYTDFNDINNNGVRDTNETLVNKFEALRTPGYKHDFFVDGTATIGDAFIGQSWKTFLVGGLGAGGRSVYALDVTNNTNFATKDVVKWELSNANLGYSYGKPIIARMKDGNWYAIVANGLDSNGDVARVLLIDLATGEIKRTLTGADNGGPNGMMAVQVRLDATRTVVDIYGGDIRGNIWRFDVSSTSAGSWSTNGSKVFSATDTGGNVQSITGGLRLGAHPAGLGTIVYFGTGKYFEKSDKSYTASTLPRNDAFYAILDKRQGGTVAKSDLVLQTVTNSNNVRVMGSPQNVDWNSKKGWYMILPDTGERVVGTPVIYGGRIIFTTIVPSGEGSCEGSGYGWLMEMDALTGKQFVKPVLDTNGDGRITEDDGAVSGMKVGSEGGLPSDPNILSGGGDGIDSKVMGTTSQGQSIEIVAEDDVDSEGLKGGSGRMSWQQLQ